MITLKFYVSFLLLAADFFNRVEKLDYVHHRVRIGCGGIHSVLKNPSSYVHVVYIDVEIVFEGDKLQVLGLGSFKNRANIICLICNKTLTCQLIVLVLQ